MTQDGVPPREECVLRPLLERHAAATPDKPFVVLKDGSAVTWAAMLVRVRRRARALQELGVQQGDTVIVWMPNAPETLMLWFAINYIGAVYVPINTAYRGGILEHVVRNAGAALMLAHVDLIERLRDIDRSQLATVVALGGPPPAIDGLAVLAEDRLEADGEPQPLARPIEPFDTQCIIYTSGTTGPSKGVLSSYAHLHATALGLAAEADGTLFLGPDDRFMVNLPMFHVGGTGPTYTMLALGASIVLLEGFDTGSFWSTIEATGTTKVILLGVMATFVMKQPPRPDERRTCLKHVNIIPFGVEGIAFRERFGVTTHTLFNMSEVSCPLIAETNPSVVATCGRPRNGVTVRLVDDNDCEVAPGAIGELVVRTDHPWAQNHGYNANPEATARAWRNGWFHTGDAFRQDEHGNFFFVDRFKDAIRRRGENVSSFEVEVEVCAYAGVREAAAVAVPSELSEDEILVAVSLAPGHNLDPAALIEFLRGRMAHFMVPRFVRVVPDLPKTPTQKVQTHVLRGDGITADTWDREKAGIVIKRDRIGR
ncbi:MAG: AMP-binding protein [Alphaproteobacteria bacterium]|nr:AMP-binding protein [Alphaproteobacteria bacterium]